MAQWDQSIKQTTPHPNDLTCTIHLLHFLKSLCSKRGTHNKVKLSIKKVYSELSQMPLFKRVCFSGFPDILIGNSEMWVHSQCKQSIKLSPQKEKESLPDTG